MASLRVVKTIPIAKGLTLHIYLDDSQPEDSVDRWITEAVCEGGPDSVPFSVPPHWHKNHTELMTVVEGRAEVTVDGKPRIVTAGEELVVPAGVVHAIQGFKGERLVIRERPDPPGDYKVLFFNDFFSQTHPIGFWKTMRIFYDGDSYAPLPLYFKFFDVAFITIFGGIAKLFVPGRTPVKLE